MTVRVVLVEDHALFRAGVRTELGELKADDGTARIEAGGEAIEADAGTLVAFEPDERHVIASDSGAKILLLLAPWPGEGHYRGGGGRPAD